MVALQDKNPVEMDDDCGPERCSPDPPKHLWDLKRKTGKVQQEEW